MNTLKTKSKFEVESAKNVLLYIIKNITDPYQLKLYKILYFAEQKHLAKYGHTIIGDQFIAMPDGPVPSLIYDSIKKDSKGYEIINELKEVIINESGCIKSLQEPDLDYLSESELECINEAIQENDHLDRNALSKKSHGEAWKKAINNNKKMELIDIAKEANASEFCLNYIKTNLENELFIAGL